MTGSIIIVDKPSNKAEAEYEGRRGVVLKTCELASGHTGMHVRLEYGPRVLFDAGSVTFQPEPEYYR